MKIVIACNPFKGSMTSIEVSEAIKEGFRTVWRDAAILTAPIADGGDGTLDAVASSVEHERVELSVNDALGRSRESEYLLTEGGGAAVIEMAKASGLAMLDNSERNVMKASTAGTGELINDALCKGAKKVLVGIGGSATNDGGTGMAAVLGYRFLDGSGGEITPCGGNLGDIRSIDSSGVDEAVKGIEFLVASDVTNPLLGPEGASAVYGPQKGATDAQVKELDSGLANLAAIVRRDLGIDLEDFPGAGAAGGLGYGLMVFLGATLKPGIDLMIDATKLADKMNGADLAVTGEGRMDSQSAHGKAPFGVLELAKKNGVPVIAFCGGFEDEHELIRAGFSAVVPVVDGPMSVEDAVAGGCELTRRAAARVAALISMGARFR